MSIVRHLAHAMGGDVGVSSEPGQGSRFWFRVQVQHITDTQDSRKSKRLALDSSPDKPENAATLLCGHVLVAEDNLVNCMVIESLLKSVGLTVSMVHDGQQAVELIEQVAPDTSSDAPSRFDLMLMDLHMPVMDGYVATEKIRQWEADSQKPRLPIIALTADAFEEDRQHCLAVGMDDFLTKPIALAALKLALARWLPVEPGAIALPHPPEPLKPVDFDAFTKLVSRLTPLLEDNKFAAVELFKALQCLVKGTDLAAEIDSLAPLLQEMRFDQVLTRLRLICFNHISVDKKVRS